MSAVGWTAAAIAALASLLGPLACATGEPEPGAGAGPTHRTTPPAEPGARLPADDDAARGAREALVTHVARVNPGLDPRVLAVMRRVPRHLFMPGASLAEAYADHAFPIGHRQTISQPTVVAIMTDALELSGRERVLEIGTGSGYQAAVLSHLAREVYSIEIVEPLGEEARERLARLGYANVQVRIGDGYKGWPEHAPFDRIILTAAPPEIPRALLDQLADGGVLVAPVGPAEDQMLERWRKRDAKVERSVLGAVRFVPMVTATPPGH